MTEEMASKKWCFQKDNSGTPHNYRCIGSECMAWRWEKRLITPRGAQGPEDVIEAIPTHGYCGLAGKP